MGLIDAAKKQEAEERAADRRLADAERLLAIQEAAKNRAAERFALIAKTKMGEGVPLEAPEVTQTTSEGAKSIGLQDGLVGMTREQVMAYENPDMLAQYDKQLAADKSLAASAVEGKTRQRTKDEAIQAALDDALLNDPAAFTAGAGLISSASKGDIEQRKLESAEKREQMRIDQRDRSDDKKFEAMMARIESATSGKGAEKTALIQNAEYLKSLGYSDDKIEKFIFEKKEIPLADLAAKILAGDKYGEITPQEAAQKAIELNKALDTLAKSAPAATSGRPPLSSLRK